MRSKNTESSGGSARRDCYVIDCYSFLRVSKFKFKILFCIFASFNRSFANSSFVHVAWLDNMVLWIIGQYSYCLSI